MSATPPPVVHQSGPPAPDFDSLPEAPIPVWVKVSALVTAGLVILSFFRLPASIRAEIANTRGDRAMEAGRADEAAEQFGIVFATYPKSKEAILNAAEAYLKANRNRDADAALAGLDGRDLSEEEYNRAAVVDSALKMRYKEFLKQQEQGKS